MAAIVSPASVIETDLLESNLFQSGDTDACGDSSMTIRDGLLVRVKSLGLYKFPKVIIVLDVTQWVHEVIEMDVGSPWNVPFTVMLTASELIW